MEQLTDQPPEDTSWQALPELAADFSRSVEEASSRLVSAAEQLTSMTTKFLETGSRLDQAVDSHHEIEAASRRSAEAAAAAAAEASAAVERARAAQDAAEGFQQRVENDYGEMAALVRDIQERIAALSVLSRPLPTDQPPSLVSGHEGPELTIVRGHAVWGDPSAQLERSDLEG